MKVEQAPATGHVPQQHAPRNVPRGYGLLLLLLAGVLIVNSLLGPLVLGVVSYPISETVLNQLIGLEAVSVLLVAPWAAMAGVAALKGHPAAPVFGFAPSAYAAYMFVHYVLGPEYARYSTAALLHLGIFVLAGGMLFWSWSLSGKVPIVPMRPGHANRRGLLLLGLAVFVLLRYSGALAGAFSGSPIETEFAQERTFFWSIFLLDLGIVVPCTVAAGVAVLRGTAVGQLALRAVVGWFSLVPPSVAAMAAVMWARDDPNASIPTVILLSAASVALGAVAWHQLRPLLTRPGGVPPKVSS